MDWISDPQAWIGFTTLTVLEIVLGIDNIIFISILASKLPRDQQGKARYIGLGLAMIMGAIALGRGILEHGYSMPSAVGGLGLGVMAGALTMPHDGSEAVYTVLGVAILALGHRLNHIAAD